MDWIKPTILHVVAVAVSLAVAVAAWKILGLESPVVLGLFALVAVATEKLVREHPSIPVGDYININ